MENQINQILNNFDFESVHVLMVATDWTWVGYGVPSVLEMKEVAARFLKETLNYKPEEKSISISTGGFLYTRTDGKLGLAFVYKRWDCY